MGVRGAGRSTAGQRTPHDEKATSMREASRYTMQIAVGFAAAGFLIIFLGWNGAASLDRVPGQLPYLISGGLAGLALVGVGLTLAIVTEVRKASAELTARLDQMTELVAGGSASATGPTAVPTDAPHVVAGRTTYHRPDCRLVADRPDLQRMSPETAFSRGLAPCRICEPEAAASA
jgi:hypothetical protein